MYKIKLKRYIKEKYSKNEYIKMLLALEKYTGDNLKKLYSWGHKS